MAAKKKKKPVPKKARIDIESIAPALKPNCIGVVEKPGENWVDCRCFKCDGSQQMCDVCGESAAACSCEDPNHVPCDNCNGTGKSRRLVDNGSKSKK